MAREVDKLSPAKVNKTTKPGLYGDGGGLYLHIGPTGGKSWIFRYMLDGKAREMGLGPLKTAGLAEARGLARKHRLECRDGIDPIDARKTVREARKLERARAITFKKCAEQYIKDKRAGWRNEKHADQWSSTLETYVYPDIGDLAVGLIETEHVMKVLRPIWATKPETASRVRGRIEAILTYATVHKWRTGENPARWRGHLKEILAERSKVARTEHHAALPWQTMATFMTDLVKEDGTAAFALRFAILTAARTNEVIGACWNEIDMDAALWIVPPERMKAGREHRVPLSDEALVVLREMEKTKADSGQHVFPGRRQATGLSNMAMLALLRRMKRDDITVHGFRSAFRDWAAETGRSSDIAEAALAHVVGDKTVAAYQRGDLLARRQRLMDDWGSFCSGKSSVTVLRRETAA